MIEILISILNLKKSNLLFNCKLLSLLLFSHQVDMTTMCYRLAKDVPQEMTAKYRPIPISNDLLDIFKNNAQKLDLLKVLQIKYIVVI